MRLYTGFVFAAIFCGLAAACGGPQEPSAPDAFKVALLTPGPISDAGWNASAYEGLKQIEKELGAETNQIETKTPAEFEQGFREYASNGYDLVFGHGFEFQDAAAAVSSEFPKTVFITTSGTTVRENVAPVVFEIEQATYLLGMVAARHSSSGKIGAVGGVEIPSVKSSFDAFKAGAISVNPSIVFVPSYIGNWEDVGAAKEATLALIDQGVDFIFHNADAAGLGVFQAAQERGKVLVFGSNKDQNGIAPEVVLASAVLSVPTAMVTVAREVKEGTFKAAVRRLGMKENVVSMVVNPALQSRISAETWTVVEETKQKILNGTLTVPKGF
ncbi:MAG: BMP family protein [candidate division Zixibacteria bacterium]|nr:BMP family protein [candidate division Zixibacteria bacterium]